MYKNDVWNNWTLKSNGIPFTSDTKSIGDGEQKLAAEFGVTPLGQNVAYDIMVNGEKWEIKKLHKVISKTTWRPRISAIKNYRRWRRR